MTTPINKSASKMKKHISFENLASLNRNFSNHFKNCKSTNSLISFETKIDRYQIIQELGRGAFAKVYLVKEDNTSNFYALKTVDKNSLYLEGRQEDAFIERNFLSNYTHPYIIKLHRAFNTTSKLCFLLDYACNKTLEDLMFSFTKIPFQVAMYYANQLIEVVAYLHNDLNYVHRDLKPQNILLDETGNIKLIDFSSVVIENHRYNLKLRKYIKIDESNSEIEDLVGTCEYCAPEMYLRQSEYSKSLDIWSLGCILYQLFGNGSSPFKSISRSSTINNIKQCKYIMKSEFCDELKDLFNKIFEVDYKKRIDINGIKQHIFFSKYASANIDILNYKFTKDYFNSISGRNSSIIYENDKKLFEYLSYDEENEESEGYEEKETKETKSNNNSIDKLDLINNNSEFSVLHYEKIEDTEKNLDENYYYNDTPSDDKNSFKFQGYVYKVNNKCKFFKTLCKLTIFKNDIFMVENDYKSNNDRHIYIVSIPFNNLIFSCKFYDNDMCFKVNYINESFIFLPHKNDYQTLKSLLLKD